MLWQAVGMESTPPPWVPPEGPAESNIGSPPVAPTALAAQQRFMPSAPLGGSEPLPEEPLRTSAARELWVAAVLLLASVLTGLATVMSWRDYGPGLNPDESGWRYADGSFGRGWIAIALAICLAVGGVLLVAGRRQLGRRWARVGSGALVVLPVLEWALGDTGSRSGPGLGLWILLVLGVVLMIMLGTVLPPEEPRSAAGTAQRPG